MSDENMNSNQGRWNHLLREITPPSPPKESHRKPEQNTSRSERSEDPIDPSVAPQDDNLHFETVEEKEEEVLSVSQINKAIKNQLEGNFKHLWIKGELSNFKPYSSGHWYFSLKDEKAQIKGLMFKGFNSRVKFQPENGMEVLIKGKITVYEPRGDYNLYAEAMEPVGAGALQKAFEQLKEKLSKEGLFLEEHKKEIPSFPKEIGVVTSPTGAAIQDILNVLGRRSKRANVTVIPARVQGEEAAKEIVKGIELANKIKKFDVLIVGRGGGSIEDLWCFNEEIVARAIFKSKIPIISSVGHEIDFTISDFVADLRAPTPSAAAEVVAKSEQELLEKLTFYSRSLRLLTYQRIKDLKSVVENNKKRLFDPRKHLRDSMIRLDDWTQRLINSTLRRIETLKLQNKALAQGLKNPKDIVLVNKQKNISLTKLLINSILRRIENQKSKYQKNMSLLDSLSPLRTVDRGYGIIRQNKKVMADAYQLKQGMLEIELRDGFVDAEVKEIRKKEKS